MSLCVSPRTFYFFVVVQGARELLVKHCQEALVLVPRPLQPLVLPLQLLVAPLTRQQLETTITTSAHVCASDVRPLTS
jgi:hypothetical protein